MTSGTPRPLRVLVYSSGNPDAAFLVAGLLEGRVGQVLIQGVDKVTPAATVARVLAEAGCDVRSRAPRVIGAPPTGPVDVGLTVCVPT